MKEYQLLGIQIYIMNGIIGDRISTFVIGKIDNIDSVMVYNYYIGLNDLTEDGLRAADVNRDGKVDNIDSVLIYNYYIGLESSFPVQDSNE